MTRIVRRERFLRPESGDGVRIGLRSRLTRRWRGECSVEQIELLRFALDVLDRLQLPYALVGSFASSIWGEPRMTLDIDFVVLVSDLHVSPLLEAFPEDDFYLSRAAVEEAIADAGQFNVIHPKSGHKIDFMVLSRS